MHVLLVQPTANSTTFGWEQGFQALGHRVTVLTETARLQFGGRPDAVVHPVANTEWSRNLARRSETFHRLANEVPSARSVRQALVELRPDLALVKTAGARNVIIARQLERLRIPWVLWQEQLPPLSRQWQLYGRLGLEPAAAFTTLDSRPGGVASLQPETAMPRISYGPYRHASRSVVGQEFSENASAEHRVRILVVASFKNHEAKHQWKVLEAAAKVGLLDGSTHFTFTGHGGPQHVGYQRVAELVRQHSAEEFVDLLPPVPFEGMPQLYGSHDILVLPSAREQFGMAVVEAMAFGLPTVVSDAVGAIGCVVPEVTGLIHGPSDVEGLGGALRRLVDEPRLRERLGSAAEAFVAEHLDGAVLGRKILSLVGA